MSKIVDECVDSSGVLRMPLFTGSLFETCKTGE
jgi:hypothetical protein